MNVRIAFGVDENGYWELLLLRLLTRREMTEIYKHT